MVAYHILSGQVATNHQMQITTSGSTIVFTSYIITLMMYVLSNQNLSFARPDQLLLTGSQVTALLGIVSLSLNYLFSSRLPFLEKLLGGLDKIYKQHRLLGITSLVLLILHPTFLFIHQLTIEANPFYYLFVSPNLGYYLGVLAFITMLTLLGLTLWIKLPYRTWKATHEFMGLVVILGGLHSLLIGSDVSSYLPLKVWIIGLAIFGTGCFIYRRFLYEKFGPVYSYFVEKVSPKGNFTEITLGAAANRLNFFPGQFAFLKFPDYPALDELHPFTIASSPQTNSLQFAISKSGDFTNLLSKIPIGAKAKVIGPYGTFSEKFPHADTAICIAGGIGITPFLSLLQSDLRKFPKSTHLFYSVRSAEAAYYHTNLKLLSKSKKFSYYLHDTQTKGKITVKDVLSKSKIDPRKCHFFLCGPISLVKSFETQLTEIGVPNSQIVFEEFNFK